MQVYRGVCRLTSVCNLIAGVMRGPNPWRVVMIQSLWRGSVCLFSAVAQLTDVGIRYLNHPELLENSVVVVFSLFFQSARGIAVMLLFLLAIGGSIFVDMY